VRGAFATLLNFGRRGDARVRTDAAAAALEGDDLYNVARRVPIPPLGTG
jgi:hypothetical protein